MTTCTWDGERLSADTRSITEGSIDQGPCQKIFYNQDGVYCAVAGDLGVAKQAALWLLKRRKKKPELNGEEEFEIILVSADRKEYYDESLEASELPDKHAIGSGRQAATAAMLSGKDGREAVKIASDLDPYTSVEFGLRSYKI